MCNHHLDDTELDETQRAILHRRHIVQGLAAGGLLTISGPALSGCETNSETGRRQFTGMVSNSQLNQMAAASWAEQKQSTPVSTDPRYTSRLKSIGKRIAHGAGKQSESWDYAVFDTETKNAFVLPGNRVGFYKGMMDFADNDDQIAAVMGHEVGHVTGQHARERVSQQMAGQLAVVGATVVGASQFGKNCSQTARTQAEYNQCRAGASRNTQLLNAALGMGLTVGVILPFSRRHESESDLLGAKYMYKAGYDPYQAVSLWEKMAEGQSSRQPEWLSTHPDPSRRARDLHDYIKYQEKLGSQGWQSIQVPEST